MFHVILFKTLAMCSFVFIAYKERRKDVWLLLWIISAVLIQPFYKFIIVREIWNIIDVIWVFLLICPEFLNKKQQ